MTIVRARKRLGLRFRLQKQIVINLWFWSEVWRGLFEVLKSHQMIIQPPRPYPIMRMSCERRWHSVLQFTIGVEENDIVLASLPHVLFVLLMIQRITIEGIRKDPWFPVNYIPVRQGVEEDVNLDDIRAAFDDIEVRLSLLIFHIAYVLSSLWCPCAPDAFFEQKKRNVCCCFTIVVHWACCCFWDFPDIVIYNMFSWGFFCRIIS